MMYASAAMAETIIVVDGNGIVREQMTTGNIVRTTTYANPSLSVVREVYPAQNTYYYDNSATSTALLAGITTGVVGTLLFGGLHHHKHKHHAPVSNPHHHNHHGKHHR